MADLKYHVCTACDIHHFDNCASCWGFGVRKKKSNGHWIPISAAEAHGDSPLPEWFPCPECGSTPKGVPAP